MIGVEHRYKEPWNFGTIILSFCDSPVCMYPLGEGAPIIKSIHQEISCRKVSPGLGLENIPYFWRSKINNKSCQSPKNHNHCFRCVFTSSIRFDIDESTYEYKRNIFQYKNFISLFVIHHHAWDAWGLRKQDLNKTASITPFACFHPFWKYVG